MSKEIFLAILLGLGVGLLVTYGVYRIQSTDTSEQSALLEESPTPSVSPDTLSKLVIHQPDDELLTDQAETLVSGSSDPDSFIAITAGDEEFITTADSSGNFSVTIPLEEGSNIISIFSIDEDGSTVNQERTVVYTTQALNDSAQTTEEVDDATNDEATDE